MSFLTELRECVDALSAHSELDVDAADLLTGMRELGGDGAATVMAEAAAIRHCIDRLVAVGSAVISELSARDKGHGGFAATKGHRSPVSLVQSITGGTRNDATRAIRLGKSLLDADATENPSEPDQPSAGADDAETALPEPPPTVWHDELTRSWLTGHVTGEVKDAIVGGLGNPPVAAGARAPSHAAVEVWAIAAEQLIVESHGIAVEELLKRARIVRDVLDPVGAEERFAKRYEARSFRTWVDGDGQHHGHIIFDDEMAAWVRSINDAALRPRRGGPRFIDAAEQASATALTDDARSNEQLAYDLMLDLLRAGALADSASVFGVRQPGVRMIVVKDAIGPRDAFGRLLAVGHLEDGGDPIPGSVLDRNLCMNGSTDVHVDACGNPLDLGREQRLFTPAQRIALAARDGGCVWPDCPMPASYCEAHHADQWTRDRGRTDIDRDCCTSR